MKTFADTNNGSPDGHNADNNQHAPTPKQQVNAVVKNDLGEKDAALNNDNVLEALKQANPDTNVKWNELEVTVQADHKVEVKARTTSSHYEGTTTLTYTFEPRIDLSKHLKITNLD
ncbi:MAG: hypothetical protein U9532_01285 ['Conium maculatum' witches'-broom phytoplasma]|nr:hypothetical protein ['Conium maculatum' witches'-broom phytoplasma]